MRVLTVREKQNEEYLTTLGIPFATVLLTDNILSHSIFDANRQIVKYLKEQGIHDFERQEKGQEAKVFITTHILTFQEEVLSKSSLYKAVSRGDKRMWFGAEILSYAEGDNIFSIIAKDKELFVINISKIDIELCFSISIENPIKKFLKSIL